MSFKRLSLGAFLCCALITSLLTPACKPGVLGLETVELLTEHEWELIEGNFSMNYQFQERYQIPSSGSFRDINQSGELSMIYNEQSQNWLVSNSYTRQEENSAGTPPNQVVMEDSLISPLQGYWLFLDDFDGGRIVQQRYTDPACSRIALYGGKWDTYDPEDEAISDAISLDFFPLVYENYPGSIVFFPFPFGESRQYHSLKAQVLVDGEELILRNIIEENHTERDTTFSAPDYGDVSIRHRYKNYYFSFRFRPKPEEGC
jgi:hypothetical protein